MEEEEDSEERKPLGYYDISGINGRREIHVPYVFIASCLDDHLNIRFPFELKDFDEYRYRLKDNEMILDVGLKLGFIKDIGEFGVDYEDIAKVLDYCVDRNYIEARKSVREIFSVVEEIIKDEYLESKLEEEEDEEELNAN